MGAVDARQLAGYAHPPLVARYALGWIEVGAALPATMAILHTRRRVARITCPALGTRTRLGRDIARSMATATLSAISRAAPHIAQSTKETFTRFVTLAFIETNASPVTRAGHIAVWAGPTRLTDTVPAVSRHLGAVLALELACRAHEPRGAVTALRQLAVDGNTRAPVVAINLFYTKRTGAVELLTPRALPPFVAGALPAVDVARAVTAASNAVDTRTARHGAKLTTVTRTDPERICAAFRPTVALFRDNYSTDVDVHTDSLRFHTVTSRVVKW